MTVGVLHNNSPEGRAALAAAVREARIRETDLVVLHALSGSAEPSAEAAETAAVSTAVDTALTDIDDADSVSWTVAVGRPDPDAVNTLLTLVEEQKSEILVVGSRHRSAVGKFLMGQTIQRLLLEIPVPVLLVKSGA
ncbi:universal stress protein [Rhodococcus sp. 14-2483-1-1]|uniref:universal stress protein n=1 Tax=Nocardiaceae TaxID=85025 RepID=UPI00050CB8CD|nr:MULTISPECIES: universal stress protein [Rhodococcus]OZE85829.1 universal stress protein [Rhodococcus sp. 15-649-2-2]OZF40486.1 universal stress protein [Rhodococcus sp. 14-2483-1-1]QIH99914.1 universal stress protein [Rhodococcus fascians A21d2]